MQKHLAALLALCALLAVPALAAAAVPRASLPDIEDEVMCPTCGVPLINAFSPQAEKERRFIRREIARRVRTTSIEDTELVRAELGIWAGAIGAAVHGAERAAESAADRAAT